MHTPDSSRFWISRTYEGLHAEGKEPENVDKEFLRLWFKERCDPYNDPHLPQAPDSLIIELSRRYITLFEMITGETFVPASPEAYGEDAIVTALEGED